MVLVLYMILCDYKKSLWLLLSINNNQKQMNKDNVRNKIMNLDVDLGHRKHA